jgi:hypothetical protein
MFYVLVAFVASALCSSDQSQCEDEVNLLQLRLGKKRTGEPWINELHYGGNVDEGVEIAGLAGTNLSDYKIVKYNGNGGKMYDAGSDEGLILSGSLPTSENGYGVKWFAVGELENGGVSQTGDGIALVKVSTNHVVQFLSWNGVFEATEGPAAGKMSQDIGVQEPRSGANHVSLQLRGTGTEYTDFTWQEPHPHSHDMVNIRQCFVVCPDPIVHPWINELHYRGHKNEGVEVAGPAGTILSNYNLVKYNGKNRRVYGSMELSGELTDMQSGFGVKWFDATPLQEGVSSRGARVGARDGDAVALVYKQGSLVVQFLSYVNTFEGIDGPASWGYVGKSKDIGVEEDNEDPGKDLKSLQLIGSGNKYSDFTWQGATASTHDLINNGQEFTPASSSTTTGTVTVFEDDSDNEEITTTGTVTVFEDDPDELIDLTAVTAHVN